MSVLFAPEREGTCAAVAWCQMEGSTARVPLALQGQGLGPLVRDPACQQTIHNNAASAGPWCAK